MIFTKRGIEILCEDYDDLSAGVDDMIFGVIRKSEDGYYRFYPEQGVAITAGMLKRLMQKTAELNMQTRET